MNHVKKKKKEKRLLLTGIILCHLENNPVFQKKTNRDMFSEPGHTALPESDTSIWIGGIVSFGISDVCVHVCKERRAFYSYATV